jgi:hypothetical protein
VPQQANRHPYPISLPAFKIYLSSMKIYDFLDHGQAKAGAAMLDGSGLIDPVELIKHLGYFRICNAWTCVGNGHCLFGGGLVGR